MSVLTTLLIWIGMMPVWFSVAMLVQAMGWHDFVDQSYDDPPLGLLVIFWPMALAALLILGVGGGVYTVSVKALKAVTPRKEDQHG